MTEQFRKIFTQRQLLISMVIKSMKSQYVGSISGISWAIVNPLILMAAISLIFTHVLRIEIKNFPLFVLSGMIPWSFLCSVLSDATNSIINNSGLIKQFNIPRLFIPLSLVLTHWINFILGMLALLPVFIIFNPKIIPMIFVFLPLVMFFYLFFTAGIAFIFSTLNVYFRDLNRLMGMILMFLFWMTPIFYSVNDISQNYRWVYLINPVAIFISIFRNILFEAKYPDLAMSIYAFLIAIISLIIGMAIFSHSEVNFIKRI